MNLPGHETPCSCLPLLKTNSHPSNWLPRWKKAFQMGPSQNLCGARCLFPTLPRTFPNFSPTLPSFSHLPLFLSHLPFSISQFFFQLLSPLLGSPMSSEHMYTHRVCKTGPSTVFPRYQVVTTMSLLLYRASPQSERTKVRIIQCLLSNSL